MRKKVALFFGSFNPIHYCHIEIGRVLLKKNLADEVWFAVSQKNPFKDAKTLMDKEIRIQCLNEMLKNENKDMISANNKFEGFNSIYTCDAIEWLKNKYPDYDFSLIIGEDQLEKFDGWKNYKYILDNSTIICVYRKDGENVELRKKYPNFVYLENVGDISATQIRKAIKNGEKPTHLTSEAVIELFGKHINEIEI